MSTQTKKPAKTRKAAPRKAVSRAINPDPVAAVEGATETVREIQKEVDSAVSPLTDDGHGVENTGAQYLAKNKDQRNYAASQLMDLAASLVSQADAIGEVIKCDEDMVTEALQHAQRGLEAVVDDVHCAIGRLSTTSRFEDNSAVYDAIEAMPALRWPSDSSDIRTNLTGIASGQMPAVPEGYVLVKLPEGVTSKGQRGAIQEYANRLLIKDAEITESKSTEYDPDVAAKQRALLEMARQNFHTFANAMSTLVECDPDINWASDGWMDGQFIVRATGLIYESIDRIVLALTHYTHFEEAEKLINDVMNGATETPAASAPIHLFRFAVGEHGRLDPVAPDIQQAAGMLSLPQVVAAKGLSEASLREYWWASWGELV